MDKSELDRLKAEYERAADAHSVARAALSAAHRAYEAGKVAFATANPHPWIGREVTRQERFGYRGETRTKNGIVAIYDPQVHRGVRGLYEKPGDLIVLSKTGKSGSRFAVGDRLGAGETEWRLVESATS